MPEQSPQPTLAERKRNLEAYIKAQEQGMDAGLADLAGRTDPDALAQRLSLLNQAHRYQEAADLIRDLPSHEWWCHAAVYALVQTGEIQRARAIVEWAQTALVEPARWQSCRAVFAESVAFLLGRPSEPGQAAEDMLPGKLTGPQTALLEEAVAVLQPAVQAISLIGQVANELEARVITLGFEFHFLLWHKQEFQELYQLLATRRPVPLLLAQRFLSGWVDFAPPDDLPARLRTEHPDSRQAKIFAAAIDARKIGNQSAAFEAAIALLTEETTAPEQAQIMGLLVELQAHLQGEQRERCESALTNLENSPQGTRFAVLARAELALHEGNAPHAAALLDTHSHENDIHWLQLRAECHLAANETAQASQLFRQACTILPAPDLMQRASDTALACGDLDGADEMLKRLAVLEPTDVRVFNNLAVIATKKGLMAEAASYYAKLRTLRPDNALYLLHEADSLVRANELEEAYARLDLLCQSPGNFEREAVLGRAQVLKSLNRAKVAFASLEVFRGKFWDDIQFVSVYLDLAFNSGHDHQGHEALMRVQELQQVAGAPQIMRAVAFDDLKEQLLERNEHIQEAHRNVLHGTFPWLLADSVSNLVPYAAMLFRTQPLDWLGDDPLTRARFAVYATDAFVFRSRSISGAGLVLPYEILRCSPPSTPVAVDQTALITLHRLGLLEQCAAYFGRLYFPIGYLAQLLEDNSALVLNQESWLNSLNEIRQKIDLGKIVVVDDSDGLTPVDEYGDAQDTTATATAALPYRLRDVVDLLFEQEKIDDPAHEECVKLFHQEARAQPGTAEALQTDQTVLIGLITLRSLASAGHLTALVDTLNVRLSRADYHLLNAERRGVDRQQETYQQHVALWDKVQTDDRFVGTATPPPKTFDESEQGQAALRYVAAGLLASQQKIPLFADDRVLQKMAVADGVETFGTDRFLVSLGEQEILPWNEVGAKFMELVRWRYRFLVPCSEILLALARRHGKHPPGQPLREMAAYFQDCMRDAGLPTGEVSDTPGSSPAHTFFYRLTSLIGEFAVDVWADGGFEDEAARTLTQWIAHSLLPGAPKRLHGNARTTILVAQSARIAMSTAFVRAVKIEDPGRANQALRALASALALSDQEYEELLTSVLHEN